MTKDEAIETAAEKLLAGNPLTRSERRLLYSTQGDFAMAQVRAVQKARKSEYLLERNEP
jgi:hypothetical protein